MRTLLTVVIASMWASAAVALIPPPTEDNAVGLIATTFSYWHECKEDAKDRNDPAIVAQAQAVVLYAMAAGVDLASPQTQAKIQVHILQNKEIIMLMGGSKAWCKWMDDLLTSRVLELYGTK